MKILIVSDAWKPQVNGVVRTLESTITELTKMGHETCVVGPDTRRFRTLSLPFYREIKLDYFPPFRLMRTLKEFKPDVIHIATEGALGWWMRGICLHQKRPFTTAYHTNFSDYVALRLPRLFVRPATALVSSLLNRFHSASAAVMVPSVAARIQLSRQDSDRIVMWSRGVDTNLFSPAAADPSVYEGMERPILLSVGRVAVEKNLPAFLSLETPGTKVIVGDGPDKDKLSKEYPNVRFLGAKFGQDLARHYASADLFVTASRTETFGLTVVEAAACGLTVVGYPGGANSDIFPKMENRAAVILDIDLYNGVHRGLQLPKDPAAARAEVLRFSWRACTEQFVSHLQAPAPIRPTLAQKLVVKAQEIAAKQIAKLPPHIAFKLADKFNL